MPSKEKIQEAVESMIRTERMHRHFIDSRMPQSGLCRTHHMILKMIACRGRIESQKEIALKMEITPAAVTGALARLEKEGLVHRTSGEDNRTNAIEPTDAGSALVQQTRMTLFAFDETLFDGFTDEQLDAYTWHYRHASGLR